MKNMKRLTALFLSLLMVAVSALALGTILTDVAQAASSTISSSQGWVGGEKLSENSVWTFQNNAVVTLQQPITIPSGKTLTLKGWGSFARHANNKAELFLVEAGGKIIIEGTSTEKPFTIDGKDVIANTSLIISSGSLITTPF